jgi:protein SCO1
VRYLPALLALLMTLPVLAASDLGGSFELIDQNGRTVTEADYTGKPALLYFGFTSCGDVCPTDVAKMGLVVDSLAQQSGIEITPIFVTIDPERDSAEKMAAYLSAFHPGFVGLTGSPEAIAHMADNYAVYYTRVPMGDTYMMDHSTFLFLLDAKGDYVAHFSRDVPVDVLVEQVGLKLEKLSSR